MIQKGYVGRSSANVGMINCRSMPGIEKIIKAFQIYHSSTNISFALTPLHLGQGIKHSPWQVGHSIIPVIFQYELGTTPVPRQSGQSIEPLPRHLRHDSRWVIQSTSDYLFNRLKDNPKQVYWHGYW